MKKQNELSQPIFMQKLAHMSQEDLLNSSKSDFKRATGYQTVSSARRDVMNRSNYTIKYNAQQSIFDPPSMTATVTSKLNTSVPRVKDLKKHIQNHPLQ